MKRKSGIVTQQSGKVAIDYIYGAFFSHILRFSQKTNKPLVVFGMKVAFIVF